MVIIVINQHLGFFIALQGIIKLQHFLINETDADPSLNFPAVDIQNFSKTFQSRIIITHQLIGNPDPVPGLNIGFVIGQNLFKERNRPVILLKLL